MIRSDGPQVAVVREDGKVHFQKVVLGRDYGAEIEVISGLAGGESSSSIPSDDDPGRGRGEAAACQRRPRLLSARRSSHAALPTRIRSPQQDRDRSAPTRAPGGMSARSAVDPVTHLSLAKDLSLCAS